MQNGEDTPNGFQNGLQNGVQFNNQAANQNSVNSIGSLGSEMSTDSFKGFPNMQTEWYKYANAAVLQNNQTCRSSNSITIGSGGSNSLSINASFPPLPHAWMMINAAHVNANSINANSNSANSSASSVLSFPGLPKEWLQPQNNTGSLNANTSLPHLNRNASIQDSVKSISELSIASWSEKTGQSIPGITKDNNKSVFSRLPEHWLKMSQNNMQLNSGQTSNFPVAASQMHTSPQAATHHNRGQSTSMQPSQNEAPGQKRPLRMTNTVVPNALGAQTRIEEPSAEESQSPTNGIKGEQPGRVCERKLNVQVNAPMSASVNGFVASPTFTNNQNLFASSNNNIAATRSPVSVDKKNESQGPEAQTTGKDGNARWNSWSHEEEVFLVAAVMDRFFRRGSLASATKGQGTGNTDCWEDIKAYYDKACNAWTALEENRGTARPVQRSTSALCRHFKIMKVRASEGDVNGTKSGNFRVFLREWDNKYNKCFRLVPE
uniref:Uncharacterized protein n=1 Tax=Aplanochytrium stocchinoi TaxID=215587 RepID=A0A7S3PH89_9STRA|mmetsp:Transcript_33542/g.41150  ORF Transcript_33542/g.41150 Transcript_33542/m.41150 type:complete len:491 (+) Transcript_33542:463-1935(+)